MAVIQVPIQIHRYIGASTDAKPTGVPNGSTFLETDTHALKITYNGGTTWVLKDQTGEVKTTPTTNTLLYRVKALLTGIILAAGSAVIGKVRMVTTLGDEVTDDTADAVKVLQVDAGGDDAIGDVGSDPGANTLLGRLKTIATALEALDYKFSIGGVNFDEYSKIKTLWLPDNCTRNNHINLKSGAGNYRVPSDAVFIALKVSASIVGVGTIGIFGWSETDGGDIAENQDILSVSNSSGISGAGFMNEVLGVFPANKYVKARTDHADSFMYKNSAIYGVEVPNGS